jgi:membrane peptidoglycan carboxypeptidase
VAFARQGIAVEPCPLTHITDLKGKAVDEISPRESRAVSPQAAYVVTRMLMEAVRSGTGKPVGQQFDPAKTPELAGKTGTTTENIDAWFIGYSPDLVLVVFVGFDRNRSLGPDMTGARVAGPIWTKMFQRILATRGVWKMKFDVPPDIVFRDVSAQTGFLVGPDNPYGEKVIRDVAFVRGTEPRAKSMGYSGLPYWRYQHPDPEKNLIWDPRNIPEGLRAQLERERPSYSEEESATSTGEEQPDDADAPADEMALPDAGPSAPPGEESAPADNGLESEGADVGDVPGNAAQPQALPPPEAFPGFRGAAPGGRARRPPAANTPAPLPSPSPEVLAPPWR